MKTKLCRIMSASAAFAVTSVLLMQSAADVKLSDYYQFYKPHKAAVSVSETVLSDPAGVTFQKLSEAYSDNDKKATELLCSEFDEIIAEELKSAYDPDAGKICLDNAELQARQDKYTAEISIKAGRAKEAVDNIRNGINSEQSLAILEEMYGEKGSSFNSDAVPSEAVYTADPEKIQYQEHAGLTEKVLAPPVSEDLIPDQDLSELQNLVSLAKELGSAKEIYDYIRFNVNYEAYAGSKKGAAVTLEELGGNDIDQAVLLVNMLRSAEIPAKYVSGIIEITAQQAIDITGAENAESAGRILTSRNNNVKCIMSNGSIYGFRLEHTWAEAFVPYTDYRGAGNNTGDKIWVPMDPSFKKLVTSTKDFDLNYTDNEKKVFDNCSSLSEKYPDVFGEPEAAPDSITVTHRFIESRDEGYLSDTLPYSIVSVDKRYSALSESMKDYISFSIDGEEISLKYLSDIHAVPINITYQPATEDDRKIIESSESLCDIPAYLVNVVPVVSFGDEEYIAKKAVSLGSVQKLSTTLKNSGGTTILSDDLVAGSYYAVNLDYQNIGLAQAEKTEKSFKEIQNDPSASVNEKFKITTSYLGQHYFVLCDSDSAYIEKTYDVCKTRQLGLAITGYEFNTEKKFGVVNSLTDGSFFIDAAYNKYNAISFSGDTEKEKTFVMTLAYIESYNESEVFNTFFCGSAGGISTATVFSEASKLNIDPVYIVSDSDFDLLKDMNIASSVKDEIKDFVNAGMVVDVIPETISIGAWNGTAYIATDLKTGSASYMLSGSKAGGSADDVFSYLYFVNTLIVQLTMSVGDFIILINTVIFEKAVSKAEVFGSAGAEASLVASAAVCNDVIGASLGVLSSAVAIGRAMKVHYQTIDFLYDYAIEGESVLNNFAQFTLDNINNLIDFVEGIKEGVLHEIGLGLLSKLAGDMAGLALDAVDNGYNSVSLINDISDLMSDERTETDEDYTDLLPQINSGLERALKKIGALFGKKYD